MIRCVTVSIHDQGHLGHSELLRKFSIQGRSNQVYHSLELRQQILWHHKNKHWWTVFHTIDKQFVQTMYITRENVDGLYIHTITEQILQTIEERVINTVHIRRTEIP